MKLERMPAAQLEESRPGRAPIAGEPAAGASPGLIPKASPRFTILKEIKAGLLWLAAFGSFVFLVRGAFGAAAVQPVVVESQQAGTAVTFNPTSGQFRLAGPGPGELVSCTLQFRSNGRSYSFPNGLSIEHTATGEGTDALGDYSELSTVWTTRGGARTTIHTAVRLYHKMAAILFEQDFPQGASRVDGQDFQSVGCAFPVFQPTAPQPAGVQWLSYTYQDWPIPIRGQGWPTAMDYTQWPAEGSDDGIRTPLVFWNRQDHCELLSPVDQPLQQLAGIQLPASAAGAGASDSSYPSPSTAAPADHTPRPIAVGPEGKVLNLPPGASFHSLLLYGNSGVVNTMLQWGKLLQLYNGKAARPRPDDLVAHTLGYWTDAGSAYYYSTEGNASYETTLKAVAAYHHDSKIPVRYYQLDSWWYSRALDGGTLGWEANPNTLPSGVPKLQAALGAPLALHNRFWSTASPYVMNGGFEVGLGAAVPLRESFFDMLFKRAAGWGCRLYEQDWLATEVQRVGYLQAAFGSPNQWLHAMDTAAADHHLAIQFCMPSMGFYLASTELPNVTEIRTSEDFSHAWVDSQRRRWMEHCQLSLPAAALGLAPYKDVFLTTAPQSTWAGATEITEALLSIFSDGPVGIGDPFGHTDQEVVRKLCMEDGVLVQPDSPAIPVEASITGAADAQGLPLVTQTSTTLGDQTWRYALALDLGDTRKMGVYSSLDTSATRPENPPTASSEMLGALPGRYVCYDLTSDSVIGITSPGHAVKFPSHIDNASAVVLAPVEENGCALIGDVGKYVTVSRSRFRGITATERGFDLLLEGPENSQVRLAVYAPTGVPSLQVAGQAVSAEPRYTDPEYPPYDPESGHYLPPGGSAGENAGDRSGPSAFGDAYAQSLYYFKFHLPAHTAPVRAAISIRKAG